MAKDFQELNAAPVGLFGARAVVVLELWEKDKEAELMVQLVSPVEKARLNI
jgi:hypothetical protein|tara:strand:+ start:253 stop:405 length:153 start_codon:yes stop_codon:yes gene_type:complete